MVYPHTLLVHSIPPSLSVPLATSRASGAVLAGEWRSKRLSSVRVHPPCNRNKSKRVHVVTFSLVLWECFLSRVRRWYSRFTLHNVKLVIIVSASNFANAISETVLAFLLCVFKSDLDVKLRWMCQRMYVAFGLKDPYWMERGLGVKSIEAVDDGLQAAPRVAGRYRRAPIDR
jgi:hypothetical protein